MKFTPLVTPFANTTLIRTQIDADLTFGDALNRVREAVLAAHARQELPFDVIAARLAEETLALRTLAEGLCQRGSLQDRNQARRTLLDAIEPWKGSERGPSWLAATRALPVSSRLKGTRRKRQTI